MNQSYDKTLCLDFGSEEYYHKCLEDRDLFKAHIHKAYQEYPELFPKEMVQGWCLNGFTQTSKKKWFKNASIIGGCGRGVSSSSVLYHALSNRKNISVE